MPEGDLEALEDVRSRVAEVERNLSGEPERKHDPHHGHGVETVREDHYRGHHIVVSTTYRVEVDGRPVTGHLGVTNDGRVHYHAVPNLRFASALELVRRLIDAFPDDFAQGEDGGHDGHGH